MATISGCRHLKVNLKAKIYIYVNSTTQRCPNKIIKIFLLENFFHLPPVLLTPVANLELRISPRIFEKIRNGPTGIIKSSGETDSRKKLEVKISDTVPLTWLERERKRKYPSPQLETNTYICRLLTPLKAHLITSYLWMHIGNSRYKSLEQSVFLNVKKIISQTYLKFCEVISWLG